MKYTYGYIKEAVLTKLDIDQEEALKRGLINKIPYYANEALGQICSTVKPKHLCITFHILTKNDAWIKATMWARGNGILLPSKYYNIIEKPVILTKSEEQFWTYFESLYCVDKSISMPDDMIAFDDNAPMYQEQNDEGYFEVEVREATEKDFVYEDDTHLVFKKPGIFKIYYKALWYFFSSQTRDSDVLDIPFDVLNCIPSYVTSQLFKIDDEVKAQVYRNEYELSLARVDDTYFKQPKTITIGGGW